MTPAPQRFPPPDRSPANAWPELLSHAYYVSAASIVPILLPPFLPLRQLPRFAGSIRPDHSNFQELVLTCAPFCGLLAGQYRKYGAGYRPSGRTASGDRRSARVPGGRTPRQGHNGATTPALLAEGHTKDEASSAAAPPGDPLSTAPDSPERRSPGPGRRGRRFPARRGRRGGRPLRRCPVYSRPGGPGRSRAHRGRCADPGPPRVRPGDRGRRHGRGSRSRRDRRRGARRPA